MNLVKGNAYLLRAIIRASSTYKGKITALLLSDKDEVLASTPIEVTGSDSWNDIHRTITPESTSNKGKLALEFDGAGTVYLDYVSLFPEKPSPIVPTACEKM